MQSFLPMQMILRLIGFLIGFLIGTALQGQQPPAIGGAAAAVVRIPSHGASATVIFTEPGRTLLLGCGHAFEGNDRDKQMRLDIPSIRTGKRQATIRLLAVDYRADLSLVEIDQGPLPFVALVAPQGYQPSENILSGGYDEMRFPPYQVLVHIVGTSGRITYTREKPRHGRSGGGLIDLKSGYLIGVCEGYEAMPGGRGMYVSLETIHHFLEGNRSMRASPATPVQPMPQVTPIHPRTTIDIPRDCRVANKTGSQCTWASLETIARYLKIQRLYHLTSEYKRISNPREVSGILRHFSARFQMQLPGHKDPAILRHSIAAGLPVAICIRMSHTMVLVGIDDQHARILENRSDQEVHEVNLNDFLDEWDGWAVVLFPDEGDAPSSPPAVSTPQIERLKPQHLLPQNWLT